MDEDQIQTIYKKEGILKKDEKDKEDEEKKVFEGVHCKAAFYLFEKDDKSFRYYCYKACKSSIWDNTVLILILLSSGKLGFDTYLSLFEDGSTVHVVSGYCDKFFNYAFIIEMVTKLIALGLIMDEGSYLRDSWN